MKYSDALTWFERDILPQPYMMKKPLLVHLINDDILRIRKSKQGLGQN